MRLVVLAVLLGGCATPSEAAIGETLLGWALPLFLFSVVVERGHALLLFRRAWALRPGQCWGWVMVCMLGLSVCSWLIFSAPYVRSTVFEPGLIAIMAVGHAFYLGSALLLVGHDRRARPRLMAVLLPMMVIVGPGTVLVLFGSTDPANNGLLWLTMPIVTVAPALLGPAMLLLAFTVALASPYRPADRLPVARARRSRSVFGARRHSR